MKGAVFDWDGTLASIDDREFYCINHALTENGSTPINNEFYIKNYYLRAYEEGTGPRMVMETALAGKSRAAIETVYESYRKIFQATAYKATLQTGAVIQVPLFVNVGDRLKVDPHEKRYISRA